MIHGIIRTLVRILSPSINVMLSQFLNFEVNEMNESTYFFNKYVIIHEITKLTVEEIKVSPQF